MTFKIPRLLFLDDQRLIDAYGTNNKIVWEYVYKFGIDAVTKQLMKKGIIKNAQSVPNKINKTIEQLELFSDESTFEEENTEQKESTESTTGNT